MAGHRLARVGATLALLAGPVVAAPSTALAADATFTHVTLTGSSLLVTSPETDFWINSVAPADVDGDGDLDLAVIGYYVVYNESVEHILVVFRNDGPDGAGGWAFTEQRVPLGPLYAGESDLAWGDYDGDLDPDLVVGSEGATALYRNDAGALQIVDTVLPGYSEDSSYSGAYDLRSLSWADYDNDGDVDLLVPSVWDSATFSYSTRLLRNEGPDGSGGWVFTDTTAVLDPTAHAQSAWADDDGDADLDLFLASADPYTDLGFVRRYENDNGTFVASNLLGIQVQYGSADWGDYDQDGDLDILVAGNILDADGNYRTVLRIYRNVGGTYVAEDLPQGPAPGGEWLLDIHAATWADYDSDGDTDVLMTGSWVDPGVEIKGRSQVYANDGGVFTPLAVDLPAPMSSIGRGGAFTWFDLDGDGDLDYLVAGAYNVPGGNGLVEAQLNVFSNDAPLLNAPPSAPTGLTATTSGNGVEMAWAAATDDSTSTDALTYQLDLQPLGGAAVGDGSAKRLPEPGNLSAVTRWQLSGLKPGTYRWTVASVDSAFNQGAGASGTFTISDPGETGVLQGTVTDASTSAPIPNATVTAAGAGSVVTDGAGAYSFSAIATGTFRVTASASGYTSSTTTGVVISSGTTTTANFVLQPAATGCTVKCLRVSGITISVRPRVGVKAVPTVVNENGTAVARAAVDVYWKLPDGATLDASGITRRTGAATFAASGGTGLYRIKVTNVTKAGSTFDPVNSTLTASITR